jgi:hypothetical protein
MREHMVHPAPLVTSNLLLEERAQDDGGGPGVLAADWVNEIGSSFRTLGENLHAGQLNQLEGLGPQRHVAIVSKLNTSLCVGFHRSLSQDLVRDTMKQIVDKTAAIPKKYPARTANVVKSRL